MLLSRLQREAQEAREQAEREAQEVREMEVEVAGEEEPWGAKVCEGIATLSGSLDGLTAMVERCRRDKSTYPKMLKFCELYTSKKTRIKWACLEEHQRKEYSHLVPIRRTAPDIYTRTTQFTRRQSVKN